MAGIVIPILQRKEIIVVGLNPPVRLLGLVGDPQLIVHQHLKHQRENKGRGEWTCTGTTAAY